MKDRSGLERLKDIFLKAWPTYSQREEECVQGMKYSQARQGRVFVIRLEDGDIVHEALEGFAKECFIQAAALIIIGGADTGSKLIVGPQKGRAIPVKPMEHLLEDVHEISGVGTLFPDEEGNPRLHMHMACGRGSKTTTGCIRRGVKVWHIMEIILFELVDNTSFRVVDPKLGFALLQPVEGILSSLKQGLRGKFLSILPILLSLPHHSI